MRKLALPVLILGLAVPLCVTAWASGGPGDAAPPPAADKSAAATSANLPDAPKPAAAPAESATASTAPATTAAPTPALESELAELRALLHAQAAELEAQRRELAEMKAKLAAPESPTPTPAPAPAAAPATAPAAMAVIAPVPPGDMVEGSGSAVGSYVDGAPPGDGQESPLALHFKGITLTPGGFAAAETAYRNRAQDADVNSAFTRTPYSGSDLSKISEFNFSGRQSRISMLMDGKLSNVKIGGYYEGDFLGSGTQSNNRQSNSYVFRQRQFWAQARFDNGWSITGGQMWSLVTETRKGMDNRTEATPLTIDAQYEAGFNWARQYGFRIVKDFSDKVWLGFSIEGSQDVVPTFNSAHGYTGYTGGDVDNFILQDTGQSAGLLSNQTTYTLNATPDFVFKGVWEPGWGHYEVFGLLRTFRDRYYPCIVPANITAPAECTGMPTTSFAQNDTRAGGGAGGGLRVPLFNKKVDVGAKGLYGDGVGRYGSSTLPDLTIRPVGTISPLHGGSGLSTIEWHVTPKLDVYANYGGDYAGRGYYVTKAGTAGTAGPPATAPTLPVSIGYGSPYFANSSCQAFPEVAPSSTTAAGSPNTVSSSTCTSDYRYVIESTLGFWYRFYKGDRGTMQFGLQYSYLQLASWSGVSTTPVPATGPTAAFPQFNPHANDSMFFTSMRYYLP